MRFVYTSLIFVYGFLIRLASLFSAKARLWVRGRNGLMARLEEHLMRVGRNDAPLVWFHASSLGEFEQGRPIIEAFRKRWPKTRIVLSFFSPSGYEVRKNYDQADAVFYLPLDTPGNASQLLDILKPQKVIFVKYDFWFNLLAELDRRRIPAYYISCLFRPGQYLFRWYGGWALNWLRTIRHFFVQNRASALILEEAGFKNVAVTGDTRFDRVYEIAKNPAQFPLIERFAGTDHVWICGSTWPEDESVLFPVIGAVAAGPLSPGQPTDTRRAVATVTADVSGAGPDDTRLEVATVTAEVSGSGPGDTCQALPRIKDGRESLNETGMSEVMPPGDTRTADSRFKIILAPHDTSEKRVLGIMQQLRGKAIRLSQLTETIDPEAKILIVDSVGILSQLYQYATIAYIGGAFGSGLHNIQEPITFGVPVFFGPGYHKFREAVDLVAMGGAFTISGPEQLSDGITALMTNPEKYRSTRELCLKYVDDNRGATGRVMEWFEGKEEM
jgi:3-deoxy-D-manno-octulosonic-acid transferase